MAQTMILYRILCLLSLLSLTAAFETIMPMTELLDRVGTELDFFSGSDSTTTRNTWMSADRTLLAVTASYDDFGVETRVGKVIVFKDSGTPEALNYDWNQTQITLRHSDYTTNDGLGYSGGVSMSDDMQHVLVCNYAWVAPCCPGNQYWGKCYVFSESVLGARDWSIETGIIPSDGGHQNYFGSTGAKMSPDNMYIMTCANAQDTIVSAEGQCYVYIASAPGLKDWQDIEIKLAADNAGSADRLGMAGFDMSADWGIIIICAQSADNNNGRCYVFYESSPGSADWDQNQFPLIPADNGAAYMGGEKLPELSKDTMHVLACAQAHTIYSGACYVWSATDNTSYDWGITQMFLQPVEVTDGSKPRFGQDGIVMSDDSQIIVVSGHQHGKIWVFWESSKGARDWNMSYTQYYEGGWLGNSGVIITPDNQHIIACAPYSGYGKCMVYTEGTYEQRDYTKTIEMQQSADTNKLGQWRGNLSPDLKTFLTCGNGYNNFQGKCLIYNLSLPINYCHFETCPGDNVCRTLAHGHICECAAGSGFTGPLCYTDIDDCSPVNACVHGTCSDDGSIPNYFNCTCDSGFEGKFCDEDIDDCALGGGNPCSNGGTCSDDGSVPNSFNCSCVLGYTGTLCDEDVNDCLDEPCFNNATCTDDGSVPNSFNCSCAVGYNGTLCDGDVNDCLSNPLCGDHGTCSDDGSVPNSFNCSCVLGYNGTFCDGDVNDCLDEPCFNNATCTDDGSVPNSFNCSCVVGYNGTLCDGDVNDCLSNPCVNGGICSDDGSVPNTFNCSCPSGLQGTFCEVDIDECLSSPCLHNGTCQNSGNVGAGNYSCLCSGYLGLNCEIDDGSIKSFCSIENDICEYGQCEWTGNPAAAVCHCHAGYTGKYCTKVAVMRNDTREITFLIFVNQSDPEQSTESVEADVLAQLLILEPDADLRNFNVSVIWNGYDKKYVVVLRITASAAVNTTVMLDAIGRHVNDTDSVWQSVTWNIDNEVDTDDDTTDNVSTTSLMLTAILAALVVLVVFLSFYLRVACVRHKRYKYKNDKGEEYVMPT